jgi:ABC-type sugar transport system ATPase subunit
MIYQELAPAKHLSVMENIPGMEPVSGPLLKWGEIKARVRQA